MRKEKICASVPSHVSCLVSRVLLNPVKRTALNSWLLALLLLPLAAAAQRTGWADDAQEPAAGHRPTRQLARYRPVAVQLATLRALLRPAETRETTAAPPVGGRPAQALAAGAELTLPRPAGGSQRFWVRAVAVMAPALAARFPQIKTYEAESLDEPGTLARLDVSPAGLHAQVLSAGGRSYYLDPAAAGDTVHHRVYYRTDQNAAADAGQCRVLRRAAGAADDAEADQVAGGGAARRGAGEPVVLRTFRLAVACTPEYALVKGNTVALALAAIVSTVNRVNGVYEKELAVRLLVVASNDRLVFLSGTGPQPDPAFSNDSGDALLAQNQRNVDRLIGPANYDLGHVFSTGGGGVVAEVPSVCNPVTKAMGVSGAADPSGDAFDIDYVAHEIGHQFGAFHTFHSSRQLCAGGNRHPETAYEPGSGTTIMAYAGICAPENVQANSDPYFHSVSHDQIRAFVDRTTSCGITTATTNRAPVPDAGPRYFIPKSTPFVLTGTATDPNDDQLTYSWEQVDRGPAGPIASPGGEAPLFRVFAPVTTPVRYFPRLSDVLANTTTLGERLPDYGRRLRFRLVARDNRGGGGGLAYDSTSLAVLATAGPFVVREPAAGAGPGQAGAALAVSWDVAGTTAAPIAAARVDILLSLDGGFTYPVTLAAATPNDGTESVVLPLNLPASTRARVMVQAVGNVFFDVSDTDFTILGRLATPTLTASSGLTNAGTTLVGLNWTATPAATYYQLQRAPAGSLASADVAPNIPAGTEAAARTFADELRVPGRYVYRLRACNALVCSEWSAPAAVEALDVSALGVAPNPSRGAFGLQLTNAQRGPIGLRVYDVLGRQLRQESSLKTADVWQYALDLSSLSAGLYLLQATLPDGRREVRRLVKE